MKKTTIVLLVLALAMLMSACAMPDLTPTAQETIPTNLEKGNNYNADMENTNNVNESTARVWPWEDPNITLPAFTGAVTAPGTIKSLKILAVGDASARDAWYFFPQIAKEAGITVKIVVLCSNGKGEIANHNDNRHTYTHYENNGSGWVTVGTSVLKMDVVPTDAWDYVVVNQSIENSGKVDTFGALDLVYRPIKNMLVALNPNVKMLFMQTWTYENNDRNNLYNGFKYYGESQVQMFASINTAIQSKVVKCSNLSKAPVNALSDGVLPVGTAVQNMRESYWTDGIARDSEYLTNTGKVLAAVTLFKCITGYDINGLQLSDPVFDHARPHLGVIKESANNAYLKPYQVSPSVYHVDFD